MESLVGSIFFAYICHMKTMEELKRELIKKHLSFGYGDFFHASVKHYEETGKASGSFFMALKAMMDEYAERKVDN